MIEEKIVQIVDDGQITALAERKERIPPDVVEFMRMPGLGPKTARRIWQELGVSTIDELRQAAESERLRTLTGLGAEDGGERPARARHAAQGDRAQAAPRPGAAGRSRRRLRCSASIPRPSRSARREASAA